MKKLIWIVVILGFLGGCAWFSLFSLNFLAWRLISPQPGTQGIALADLDGD